MYDTFIITLTVKDPDEFGALIYGLDLDEATRKEYFEFGEYATIELEIDKTMKVVSGKIIGKTAMKY